VKIFPFIIHEVHFFFTASLQGDLKTNVMILDDVCVHFAYNFFAEFVEVMEMDSPFDDRARIEGKNSNILKKGSTITLTCKVMENEVEGNVENTRRIDWMKNGELLSLKVGINKRGKA
jgi:hypothetical protein